jgi:hypothetical protein
LLGAAQEAATEAAEEAEAEPVSLQTKRSVAHKKPSLKPTGM